ncbi:MAG: hypothetical protein JNL98_11630 [Bryobacterales bacterium]|nr:hypothetical protein [Bryobacterales bacterium]
MNFERLIQHLSDSGVEFVVIGGWAAIFHGSTHVTNDLDICYSRDKQNLRRLAGALAPFHPRPRGFPDGLPFVWDATTLANGTILTLTTDLGTLDLLAEVSGIGTYEEATAAKKSAGRPKDLLMLPELEGLLEASEDD